MLHWAGSGWSPPQRRPLPKGPTLRDRTAAPPRIGGGDAQQQQQQQARRAAEALPPGWPLCAHRAWELLLDPRTAGQCYTAVPVAMLCSLGLLLAAAV